MKISKYNFTTWNQSEELLLFNTFVGTKSLIKVSNKTAKIVDQVLNHNLPIKALPPSVYQELLNSGYIIPDERDENLVIKDIFLDYVCDSRLELTIIPTEQCNFRCTYCYETFPDHIMNDNSQESIINFVKKNLHKYKSLHISWFGGEPLLAINTIMHLSEKFKKICKYYKKPYTASMSTNGFALDVPTLKKLIKCNIFYYQITLDGTKEIHDKQRIHKTLKISTYDVIINNLIQIKNTISSPLLRITIRSNFNKYNLFHIEEYLKHFSNYFGDDNRFQFYIRPIMNLGGERINELEDHLFESTSFQQLYYKLMMSEYKLNLIYDDFLGPTNGVCVAGKKNYFVITPDCSIYKCTCNFQGCPEGKIGELSKEGNMIIKKDVANQWLCNLNTCKKDCFYAPICLRDSCPAKRILNKSENQIYCPHEKQNLSEILQVLDSYKTIFRRIGIC